VPGHLHRAYQRTCDFSYGPVQVLGLAAGSRPRNFALLDTEAMIWQLSGGLLRHLCRRFTAAKWEIDDGQHTPVIGAGYPYGPHLARRGSGPGDQYMVQAHDGQRSSGPQPVPEPRLIPVDAGVQGGRPGKSGPRPTLGSIRAIQESRGEHITERLVVPAGVEVPSHYLRPWGTG
jgi:hypothetical protein